MRYRDTGCSSIRAGPWNLSGNSIGFGGHAGFIGLCVNGQVTGVPASDPIWDPFYQLSIEANRPIMILNGLTGIGQGLPGGDGYMLDHGHPRHIAIVAARYPALNVLAARPAYPWQDEMLAILAHKPNVTTSCMAGARNSFHRR